jgi:hypothetical protein
MRSRRRSRRAALLRPGLRLVYAFNHEEAIRAFREAARLDPTCAMAWWGVALASGPNYNLPLDPEREAAALDAVARGIALAGMRARASGSTSTRSPSATGRGRAATARPSTAPTPRR